MEPDCVTPQQRKASLLRALGTEVLTAAGVNATSVVRWDKTQIIKHYGQTEEQKLRELLSQQTLGDQKPSIALRKMQDLAGNNNDGLVQMRFLQILPDQVQVALAVLDDTSLSKLAEIADKMVEHIGATAQTASVGASPL